MISKLRQNAFAERIGNNAGEPWVWCLPLPLANEITTALWLLLLQCVMHVSQASQTSHSQVLLPPSFNLTTSWNLDRLLKSLQHGILRASSKPRAPTHHPFPSSPHVIGKETKSPQGGRDRVTVYWTWRPGGHRALTALHLHLGTPGVFSGFPGFPLFSP